MKKNPADVTNKQPTHKTLVNAFPCEASSIDVPPNKKNV